jgi:hypothetical protein
LGGTRLVPAELLAGEPGTGLRRCAALADVGELEVADSGFDFRPPGPEQDQAFRDVEWEIRQYPALRALWASTPAASSITVDQAC